jgi:hypothetical protein
MSTQFLLDEGDIKDLTKLMLVMIETQESRKQLCRELGINPQEVSFIIGTSDETFCTELIDCLNRYGYQEYLCKLCCNKLYPVLNKSVYSHRISILEKIIEKINCNCNHEQQNYSILIDHPSDELKPKSWVTKIGNVNKKLLASASGAIIVLCLVVQFSNSNISAERTNQELAAIENTLKNKQWKLADQKTTEILLREAGINDIVGSEKEDVKLNEKEIQNISCPILQKLNELWESNSQGRFGFRKQNSIWKSVNQKNWDEFADHVGWRENNQWTSISFTTTAKEGHLPSFIYVPNGQISWDKFFDRVEICRL